MRVRVKLGLERGRWKNKYGFLVERLRYLPRYISACASLVDGSSALLNVWNSKADIWWLEILVRVLTMGRGCMVSLLV